MFKIFLFFAVLTAFAMAHGPPSRKFFCTKNQLNFPIFSFSAEKIKSDLSAVGVSAAGIQTISSFMAANKPGPNGKAAFDAMLASLTEADRTAFQKLKKGGHPPNGAPGNDSKAQGWFFVRINKFLHSNRHKKEKRQLKNERQWKSTECSMKPAVKFVW